MNRTANLKKKKRLLNTGLDNLTTWPSPVPFAAGSLEVTPQATLPSPQLQSSPHLQPEAGVRISRGTKQLHQAGRERPLCRRPHAACLQCLLPPGQLWVTTLVTSVHQVRMNLSSGRAPSKQQCYWKFKQLKDS